MQGPGGRIMVQKSQVNNYKERGYSVVEKEAPAPAPAPEPEDVEDGEED